MAIKHQIGDRYGEADSLGNLGSAYLNLGDTQRAIGYHEQSLAINREIGDRRGEATSLGNLGNVYSNLGDSPRAIEYYERQLVIVREIGDRRGEALGSWNLGDEYAKQGDLSRAIAAMQVCVDYERTIGHPDAEKDAARVDSLRAQLEDDEAPSPTQTNPENSV